MTAISLNRVLSSLTWKIPSVFFALVIGLGHSQPDFCPIGAGCGECSAAKQRLGVRLDRRARPLPECFDVGGHEFIE